MTEKRITITASTPLALSSEVGAITFTAPAAVLRDLRAQVFFDDLAKAARAPGYGDQHRSFVTNLLLRAQEAGIYHPEAT